jgi:hypothetical protein
MNTGVSIPDVEAAVSILFGNKKQCVSSGWGNWTRDGKRRFVWSLVPFEGERYALTVVAELPVDGLEDGQQAVLVINDVPCTVFWAYSDSAQKRVAHIGTETEHTRYAGFVADDKVVRWAELQH